MGAEVGKPISNLGITSMASTTPTIENKELSILLKELQQLSFQKQQQSQDIDSSEAISKKELDDCLKKCGKIEVSDLDVYTQLFILFDINGNETVNYKDFIAGIYGCLTSGLVSDRLKFVLNIYINSLSPNNISKSNLKRLLSSINNVAAFFGDPVLSLTDIDIIVQDVYKASNAEQQQQSVSNPNKEIVITEEIINVIKQHPLIQVFMLGEGKVRFGDSQL